MMEARKARRHEIFGWCMFDFANQAYTLLIPSRRRVENAAATLSLLPGAKVYVDEREADPDPLSLIDAGARWALEHEVAR